MARLAHDIDYVARLKKVRDGYITAYPRQRLHVIRQRLEDHHFGPNRLVTSVSAVEAYARSLALHRGTKSRADLRKRYPKYRDTPPKALVAEYLKARGISDPTSFFGEDNWELFGYAVEYRNLLTHECPISGA